MELIDVNDIQEITLEDSLTVLTHRKGDEVTCHIEAPIVLTIPDNPTNGDMIRAMFKPYQIFVHTYCVNVYLTEHDFNTGNCWQGFDVDWWNAPYNFRQKARDEIEMINTEKSMKIEFISTISTCEK